MRQRSNLIVPTSSFVGRNSELAALGALFEEARLVTVLGPGGMGKTRFALRYAEDRLPSYASQRGGGVWFVDLGEARVPSSALAAVAAVLGVELVGLGTDDAVADAVARGISGLGRTLLVLDNLEHLADALAPTIERWVRTARSCRMLVTSRVALGIDSEQLLPLGPLSRDEATELFVGRVRQVRGGRELGDIDTVGDIVDAIDRMPLAIELAASRTRLLSTADIQARLERPLDLLGSSRSKDRHGSLRRTVLDSVALLTPTSRRLFALGSVLRNGFTLADAEAVLGDQGDVLEALDDLSRTSLLRVSAEAGAPARYGYFETIRDVAEELAQDDPARAAVLAAHARHFARSASSADLDNLLLAHETAVRLAEGEAIWAADAAAIAIGLGPLLSARGLSRLRARLFDHSLTALGQAGGDVRVRVLLGRGLALRELGETARARRDFEQALSLAESDGLRASALAQLAALLDVAGDTAGARPRLLQALELLANTQDDARKAEAHLLLGHGYRREGDLAKAKRSIVEAVARYRKLGHDEGLASAMYELAVVDLFAGRRREALALFDEGLAVARRSNVRLMVGSLTTARGCLLQEDGQVTLALEHHAEAARIFRELGSRYREASALFYLATAYIERGDPTEALALLVHARHRIESVGAPRYEALMAAAAATALALLDRFDEAKRELEEAEAALGRVPDEPALGTTVTVHRWVVEVRSGRRDGPTAAREAEERVREGPNDDSRFALRMLKSLVDGRTQPGARHELVVWSGGSAFTPPGHQEPVPLPAGSPLRRILEHLVTCRLESPGEVVSIDEVIHAGWPDEKIGAEAALNRAYVALSSLRKKGLRGVLVSTAGGYALSRGVAVRRAND
jgi:predicted ATPase